MKNNKGPFKMKKSPAELRFIKQAIGGALSKLGLGGGSSKPLGRTGFGGGAINTIGGLGGAKIMTKLGGRMAPMGALGLGNSGERRTTGQMLAGAIAQRPLFGKRRIGQAVSKAFKGANLRGMFRTR